MEDFGNPSPIPRLRLTRQSPKFDDGVDNTPQAGPSRLSSNGHRTMADVGGHEYYDEADDAQSTPKMPVLKSMSPEPPSVQNATVPADTPAARLRALLSRVPNSPSGVSPPAPVRSSEPDSDFDPPRSSPTNTPSIARESLKDLFSRALRDPGDTPQKNGRRRRNSVDVSEVESSPRVERERAKNKGKRRSLSEEEADNPSRSGTSLRSSQAATFDNLRARLTSSQTQLMNQHAPFDDRYDSSLSDTPADPSDDAPFLRQLQHPPATPPAATSTPHQSMQLPSQLQSQSNLLEQDSDMQKAMKNFDSFEEDSGPGQRPLSFPSARASQASHSRPLSHPSDSKVHSASRVHGVRSNSLSRHGSAGQIEGGSSGASSSLSHAEFHQREHEREQELNRDREREWNKPHSHPKTPEVHHRHSHSHGSNSSGGRSASPMLNLTNGLSRRGSVSSLRSLDDGRSSRTSSFGSQAEYRERIHELEKERNIEREREWNKRHPATSRPTSSLSMHSHSPQHLERTRTQSHPTHPSAATSLHTPDHPHRHHSFNSGRSTSPSSSVRSRDSEKELEVEVKHEIEHVRERNWNAPHPKWNPNAPHHRERSVSPLPPSLSPRPSISHVHSHSHSHSLRASSPRVESPAGHLLTGKPALRPSSSHSSLNVKDKAPRGASPLPHSATSNGKQPATSHRPTNHTSQSKSPLPRKGHADPHPKETENGNAPKTPASSSRFGWQFPRNKNPLPPLEFDQLSPGEIANPARAKTLSSPSPTPGSRPTSRASGSVKPSHIPVRSPHVSERNEGSSGSKKGHKRSTTELSESAGGIPRLDQEPVPFTEDNAHQDSVLASDEEPPSPPPISTPTMRPMSPADDPPESSPSPKAPLNNDEARLQKALARSLSFDRSSPTPWPPPPPEPSLILMTPPRRQPFSSPKVEFETPPPPKGMPELPGPPSSEDEADEVQDWMPAGLYGPHFEVSSAKTPKPPGAWASTPLLSRRDPLARNHTLPDYDGFSESTSESGLITPVASLSRASSLPAQTPVPPGAWLATPGTDRRRSVLKVRFDVESEQSASDAAANGHAHVGDSDGPQIESASESSFEASTPKAHVNGLPGPVEDKTEEVDAPATPRSTPPPSLRKSPSVRIVDAFGREQTPLNEVDISQDSAVASPVPSTPRSKSSVRIVDAMGREVEEVLETTGSEGKNEEDIMLGHNEALRRVRQSIADLASGLSEVDSSDNELLFNNKRLSDLNDVSQAARDARHKLSQTLRMARNTEDDLRSKYGSLRASMRKSKLLPAIITDSRLPWTQNNTTIFWGVVFAQVLLVIIMYRISTARARDIFLNTYYDPYYPELHLYATKPDTFRLSMSHASHWSIFSIPDTLQRSGWKAAASEAWNGFAMVVWDWQMQLWDTWGTAETVSWPPT